MLDPTAASCERTSINELLYENGRGVNPNSRAAASKHLISQVVRIKDMQGRFQFNLKTTFLAVLVVALLCIPLRQLIPHPALLTLSCFSAMGFLAGCSVMIVHARHADVTNVLHAGIFGAVIAFLLGSLLIPADWLRK